MIKRQNILDLLGGDSKKYHSCVITSYSFDVMFFEQAVLPKLSRAGITNINILVDASMFEKQLSSFSGKEYLDRRHGYSVTPIRMNGAFHPKFLLAVGKTKGFLAVGSGNLTGSGLSFNEEIWGTFFYKESFDNSLPIFGQVKEYLQQFKTLVKGVNLTKLEWLETFSPWYKELDAERIGFSTIKDSKVSLLTSFGDRSFFKEVFSTLQEKPESIQVLSPYYNRNGQFLDDIIKKLNPKSIHCIVNSEMGSLPLNYKTNLVKFTDWNFYEEKGKRHPNLHAKAIQISYLDKTYFILGSANATIEAFGDENRNTSNAEAVLVVESSKPRDFFKDLGILFPKQGNLDLENMSENEELDKANDSILVFDNYIQQVEIKNNSIVIYFSKFEKGDYQLIIEDGDGEILIEREVRLENSKLEVANVISVIEEPFKCFLTKMDNRVSNYGYFHDVNLLLKTNPDERLSRFNDLKQHAFFEDLEMELFLDFLSSEDIFHNDRSASMRSEPGQTNASNNNGAEESEIVRPEVFNKNATVIEDDSGHEIHISTIIEDFLNALNFKVETESDELSDNIEEAELIEDEDGGSEKGPVTHRSLELSYSDGNRIRRKLQNVFEKIEKYVGNADPEDVANLHVKPINAMLIGFNLMLKYWKKEISRKSCSISFKYTKLDDLKKLENAFNLDRQSSQLNSGPKEVAYFADVYVIDDIKKHVSTSKSITLTRIDELDVHVETSRYFSQNISDNSMQVGVYSFLIRAYCDVLHYMRQVESKSTELNGTWEEQKIKLLELAMIVLASYVWSPKSQIIKKIIVLNTFYFLDIKINRNDFKLQLLSKVNAFEDNSLMVELEYLLGLYDSYEKFRRQIETDASVLKQELNSYKTGALIFSKTYGFAKLDFVYSNKTVNIFTPFGGYDEKTNVYGYSEKYLGSNVIVYN
ncbi:hypothetical protein [Gelidibacter sp.]|uniref:hypothetical protein n=1 Tax=Gelidibacter sp. TaxID=2018083 RepID=UPI0032669B34